MAIFNSYRRLPGGKKNAMQNDQSQYMIWLLFTWPSLPWQTVNDHTLGTKRNIKQTMAQQLYKIYFNILQLSIDPEKKLVFGRKETILPTT